jgi:tetratricopeptide (TPR) repeat protein
MNGEGGREMFELKPISRDTIPRAIQKAERYRLLNQSWAAESICLDILEVDPDNQQVLVMLVLALTDLHSGVAASGVLRAKEYLARIRDDYQRVYYTGMIAERRGQALLAHGGMGSGGMAYDSLREAMEWYEKAEAIRPPGNDDAILRWNTCARVLSGNSHLAPAADSGYEPALED